MLAKQSISQLLQLKTILNQVSEFDYLKTLSVLESGTLGKHVRHILEFYQCLFLAQNNDTICYDDRKRNLLLEENVRYANDCIDEIIDKLELVTTNKRLLLNAKFEKDEVIMETSLFREITYNLEHTVHHLAIIRIAITTELKYIQLSQNFGYAHSTINYLESQKKIAS